MIKSLLDPSIFKWLDPYIEDGTIDSKFLGKLLKAKNCKELFEVFKELTPIEENQKDHFWKYIIYHQWNNKDIRKTVFNEFECIFFRELLNNLGTAKRTQCLNKNIFLTAYMLTKAAEELEKKGIIKIIKLGNNECFYIIDVKFYMRVKNGLDN